jgi:8-oxo-dGTP diphosphatase
MISRQRIRLVMSLARKLRVFRWALSLAVRLVAPRNLVGVVGVLWNERGQVLLVEHVMRFRYAWGLPGGWIERGEDPFAALRREVREEVGLTLDDPVLLLCESTGGDGGIMSPRSIAVAFSCSATGDPVLNRELLSYRWTGPEEVPAEILRFHRKAIETAIRARAATGRE